MCLLLLSWKPKKLASVFVLQTVTFLNLVLASPLPLLPKDCCTTRPTCRAVRVNIRCYPHNAIWLTHKAIMTWFYVAWNGRNTMRAFSFLTKYVCVYICIYKRLVWHFFLFDISIVESERIWTLDVLVENVLIKLQIKFLTRRIWDKFVLIWSIIYSICIITILFPMIWSPINNFLSIQGLSKGMWWHLITNDLEQN